MIEFVHAYGHKLRITYFETVKDDPIHGFAHFKCEKCGMTTTASSPHSLQKYSRWWGWLILRHCEDVILENIKHVHDS